MSASSVQLIVNCDDIGIHPDADFAAFELIDAGLVTSLVLMAPAPNFSQVTKLALERDLPVGLHLTLTNEWQDKLPWSPVLSSNHVPSLYNHKRLMWASGEEVVKHARIEDVEKELRAQILLAKEAGLILTHIDSHMLVLLQSDALTDIFLKLAKEFDLPLAFPKHLNSALLQRPIMSGLQSQGYRLPDVHFIQYNPDERELDAGVAEINYKNMIEGMQPGINYMALHVAKATKSLSGCIGDSGLRVSDYNIWASDGIHQYLREHGVTLVKASVL
ncbi:ChbG/HpnK family deacetylase [Parasalinivibrio latis]|uniref:ChbG/HpnK family deacetylase n=1 Tax=Parasalinivibrio latis TaxID=2952610 RepID=UPI0030E2CF52